MLMQLKPGLHGSASDVHSLMSAEGTEVTGSLAQPLPVSWCLSPGPHREVVGLGIQTSLGQGCTIRLSHPGLL